MRKPSAAVAPRAVARARTSASRAASHRHSVQADRRQSHADRHGLAVLAARADPLVEREIVPHAAHPRERVGAIADERGALHRLGDLAILDQVGFARGEHELAARDVHLSATEIHRVETARDRLQNFARVVLPGEHERVGHPRHRRVGVRLAPTVARGRLAHQARVEPILHVAAQDAVLDQDVPAGRRAFVVDVEGAAPIRDRAVIDHRDQLGGDLLSQAAGECRDALAVEIAFEPVADSLVQQDARPAGSEHDGHRPRRRVDRRELQRGLTRGLGGEALPPVRLEVEVERHATAAAEAADLAPAAVLGDRRDVEPGQRPYVADGPARRRRDQHDDFFAGERDDHLPHARIGGATRGVDPAQQVELARELGDDRRLGQRVEIVRPPATGHGDDARAARPIRDRARLARGLFEILQREIVGVGVARARARLRADAGALAHMTGRFLHYVFFEYELFVHAVLEVDVGVVHPPGEVAAEQALHEGRRDVESLGEEPLGRHPRDVFSHPEGPNPNRRREPAPNFSNAPL